MMEKEDQLKLNEFLEAWQDIPQKTKKAFIQLKDHLAGKNDVMLTFNERPGITYSLKAAHLKQKKRDLFAMVDVIDDDPENRWLSVCFYDDMITDPEEKGDFVPEGLFGQDAHCIDLYEWSEKSLSYLEKRLDEAYENAFKEGL